MKKIPKPKRKYKKHRFRNHIPNPKGVPRKEIDFNEFEKLCGIQSTLMEMCAWFDVDDVTLEKRVKEHYGMPFAEVFKRKRGRGKVSLRRRQFQAALDGEIAMLIFLGKQYLDQADKKEVSGIIRNAYESMSEEQLKLEDEKLSKLLETHDANKENQTKAVLCIQDAREVIEIDPANSRDTGPLNKSGTD